MDIATHVNFAYEVEDEVIKVIIKYDNYYWYNNVVENLGVETLTYIMDILAEKISENWTLVDAEENVLWVDDISDIKELDRKIALVIEMLD